MRSMVTVSKSATGPEFRGFATGKFGGGYSNAFAGVQPETAARFAVREALRYCTSEGCDLWVDEEIRPLLPDFHDRDITVL